MENLVRQSSECHSEGDMEWIVQIKTFDFQAFVEIASKCPPYPLSNNLNEACAPPGDRPEEPLMPASGCCLFGNSLQFYSDS
jgi:hypothetical protein